MRTRGELLFIEIFALVGTIAICSALGWFAYWLFESFGFAALAGLFVFTAIVSFGWAIRTDLREGRYELHELPGAIFRRESSRGHD